MLCDGVHTVVCVTVVFMPVDRISVTMDPELGAAVRDAAARAGMSVSAWIAEAAADKVRNQLLGAALDAWEAEDGPLTAEELAAANEILKGSRQRTPRGSAA
jgi:hypothetical protein